MCAEKFLVFRKKKFQKFFLVQVPIQNFRNFSTLSLPCLMHAIARADIIINMVGGSEVLDNHIAVSLPAAFDTEILVKNVKFLKITHRLTLRPRIYRSQTSTDLDEISPQ